ncbi:MAG: polysaccharide biosynthesis PFTS motif protein [Nitrospirae bacterium]|nr:polysaccharide biosynthesis PFTS motif protein [Nitrospirota bacterium]
MPQYNLAATKSILVPEIHPTNLLLFWILSFFANVRAYTIHEFCVRLGCSRIQPIDLGQHFSPDDLYLMRSKVVDAWEPLERHFPASRWSGGYRRHVLDFSGKAKQDLAKRFEIAFLLHLIAERSRTPTYVVESRHSIYLSRLDGFPAHLRMRTLKSLSFANTMCDAVYSHCLNLIGWLNLAVNLLRGCMVRRGISAGGRVAVMWDGVNPNELDLSSDKRSFTWVVDDEKLSRAKTLFILPRKVDADWQDKLNRLRGECGRSGFRAGTLLDLYRIVPVSLLLFHFARSLELVLRLGFYSIAKREALDQTAYLIRMMAYDPIVNHFRPTCYVTSGSALGNEHPVVVYLKALGVRTVIYCYGSNAHLFAEHSPQCDFRWVVFSGILSDFLLVWSRAFQVFVESHSQTQVRVEVVGPLMPGDERVCLTNPAVMKRQVGKSRQRDAEGLKWVVAFDEAPIPQSLRRLYPYQYTQEYSRLFLRDVVALIDEFSDILLLYKPQRSLSRAKFTYSAEFIGFVGQLVRHERAVVLDDDVNPWVPVAVADMAIAMPFTSPAIACLHYGKRALFHDPSGIAIHHRYEGMSQYITHGYAELRKKIDHCLHSEYSTDSDKQRLWGEVGDFIGRVPGSNSSEPFRDFLVSLEAGGTDQ